MKNILYLFLILASFEISAQSISKQVLAPLGGSLSNSNIKLSYTAGEIVVGGMTSEDGSFQLGNGYYPSLNLNVLSINTPTTNLLVKVYPNPIKELIFISHPSSNYFKVFISDLTGKVLLQKEVVKGEPINIENYSKGIYLVKVTTEDKQTNTYKIIKQ
ncbi:MAG: T9SS type A sorting domain-containing protein [Flavobacteriaceae bacterium]